jgi:hypothetical protein
MTTLNLVLQIHSKLQDAVLPQFGACYKFIASSSVWEQMLSESCKKDYARYFDGLQNVSYEIFLFLKCELLARAFTHLRDIPVSYFFSFIALRELYLLE